MFLESLCVKKGNTFGCFWLFLRKQREGSGPKRGHLCSGPGGWPGLPLGRTIQRHSDWAAAAARGKGGGFPLPALRPLTPWAPWEGEGSPCPEWALGGSGTFRSSAQGGAGRDRRPRGSGALGGAARSVLVSSESRQCQVREWGGKPGFASYLGPWDQSRFLVRLGSLGAELLCTPKAWPRGVGQCWGAKQRPLGVTPDFPGAP